jgi:hypothetical protein
MLAKKAHERPSSREALMLIPSFVKKAYEQRKSGVKQDQNMPETEPSIDESF